MVTRGFRSILAIIIAVPVAFAMYVLGAIVPTISQSVANFDVGFVFIGLLVLVSLAPGNGILLHVSGSMVNETTSVGNVASLSPFGVSVLSIAPTQVDCGVGAAPVGS